MPPENPPSRGAYSERVRELFRRGRYAGSLPKEEGFVVTAEASEGGSGAVIELSGRTDGGRWSSLRYRVFGCPHTIAAAEWAAEHFETAAVGAADPFPVDEIIEKLGVPVEKTGRILLLEDAFRALEANRLASLDK